MEEKTALEKEFGVDLFTSKVDIQGGIELSLRVEKRGREFYLRNARKIQNIQIKRFIEFLANEEGKHIEILESLKQSLGSGGTWVEASESKKGLQAVLEDLRVFKGRAGKHVREAGDVTIILEALKTEKDLVEFYERFSHRVSEPGGKKFFLRLSEWERTHYQLLEGIYDSITFFRMES